MRSSLKTGFSFGLTSGIITTLGLIVGLYAGTGLEIAVIGGILTIAIADAFSDALGVHISQESLNRYSDKSIWEATIATFLSKFVFALSFIVPILFFELSTAVWVCVLWGFSILSVFSFIIAKQQSKNPVKVVLEHLAIGLAVVFLTHYVGKMISSIFI